MVVAETQGKVTRCLLGDGSAAQADFYEIDGSFGRDRAQVCGLGSEAIEPGRRQSILKNRAPDILVKADQGNRAGHLFADPVDDLGDVHAGAFRGKKSVEPVSHDHDRPIVSRDAEQLHETLAGFAV